MRPQRFNSPFVTLACAGILVFRIVGRQLIDAVVGQMHVAIVQRVGLFAVLDCGDGHSNIIAMAFSTNMNTDTQCHLHHQYVTLN